MTTWLWTQVGEWIRKLTNAKSFSRLHDRGANVVRDSKRQLLKKKKRQSMELYLRVPLAEKLEFTLGSTNNLMKLDVSERMAQG